MSVNELSTLVPALVAVVGFFYGMSRFIGKVDQNTKAMEKLTAVFDKFTEKTTDTLSDHEHRITVLETKSGD